MSVASRQHAPATWAAVPSFVPEYGSVRIYDADGHLVRVIAKETLVAERAGTIDPPKRKGARGRAPRAKAPALGRRTRTHPIWQ